MKFWSKPFQRVVLLTFNYAFTLKCCTYTEHVQSTLEKHNKNEILVMKKKAFLFSPLECKIFVIFIVFSNLLCTCSVRALYVLCRSAL